MKGSEITDEVARRIATPSGRRTVLAGVALVLAGMPAAARALPPPPGAVGGDAWDETPGRKHRRRARACRRDGQCRWAEACVNGTCRGITGFAKIGDACKRDDDCSQADGSAICDWVREPLCVDGGQADETRTGDGGTDDLCGFSVSARCVAA